MLKLVILLINLAMADKTVTCDKVGCSYSGAGSTPVVTVGTDSKTISFDNRTDGERNLEVKSGTNLDVPTIVIEGRNSSNVADLKIEMPSRFDRFTYGSNNAPSAPNVVGIFDNINNITVDLSGNQGSAGETTSKTCYQMAMSGQFDQQYSTGTRIRDLISDRRTAGKPTYDSSAKANECEAVDVTAIKNIMASPTNPVMCETGFKTVDGWGNTELLTRIKPKRFCAPSGFAFDVKRCRITTKRYYCGLVRNIGDGSMAIYTGANFFTFAQGGSGGAFVKTEVVYYDDSFALIPSTQNYNTATFRPANTNPALYRGMATIDILRETYYTSATASTVRDYIIYSNDYTSVINQCKTRNLPAGAYPKSSVTYSGVGRYASGLDSGAYPYSKIGVGASTFFPLQLDKDLSLYYETTVKDQQCNDPQLMEDVLAENGYSSSTFPGGNPSVEEISVISGHASDLVDLTSSCPAGTSQYGILRNYDACAIPDFSSNVMIPNQSCIGANKTEEIPCSSISCSDGITYTSNRTFKGLQFEIDGGENGSTHGSGNIFTFIFTGTMTNLSQKGVDGARGSNNLSIVTENKTCSKIEDQATWKSQYDLNPTTTDVNASQRSTPILTIENVLFAPITVLNSTKTIGEYRETSVLDVKVFTHTDFNTRKILLKESQ